MLTTPLECARASPDTLAIRSEVVAIMGKHGGRYRIEEWRIGNECHLKVVMTWKFRANGSSA